MHHAAKEGNGVPPLCPRVASRGVPPLLESGGSGRREHNRCECAAAGLSRLARPDRVGYTWVLGPRRVWYSNVERDPAPVSPGPAARQA